MYHIIVIISLALIAISLIVIPALCLRGEWWPRCPVCGRRGYRQVCSIGDNDPGAEVRRCRTCHVYRIKLNEQWRTLNWHDWQREASEMLANPRPPASENGSRDDDISQHIE